MVRIPAITLSDLDICWASRIRYPSPLAAAIISAPMMALQLYPSPMRIPTRISGTAEGRIIRQKLCQLLSPNTIPTSRRFLLPDTNPFRIFRYMGKKEASTMIIIFDVSPIPNHRIKRAIRLMGGTFLINSRKPP